jgi:hypothetical protein
VSAETFYGADDLTHLEGLEAVRKRPGMYIGSTDSRGINHLFTEVVDNSTDEGIAGHATKVVVTLHADGGIQVDDDGRGIPTGVHTKSGLSGVELVLTRLHRRLRVSRAITTTPHPTNRLVHSLGSYPQTAPTIPRPAPKTTRLDLGGRPRGMPIFCRLRYFTQLGEVVLSSGEYNAISCAGAVLQVRRCPRPGRWRLWSPVRPVPW